MLSPRSGRSGSRCRRVVARSQANKKVFKQCLVQKKMTVLFTQTLRVLTIPRDLKNAGARIESAENLDPSPKSTPGSENPAFAPFVPQGGGGGASLT